MLADSSLDNSEWVGAIHTETLKYLSFSHVYTTGIELGC